MTIIVYITNSNSNASPVTAGRSSGGRTSARSGPARRAPPEPRAFQKERDPITEAPSAARAPRAGYCLRAGITIFPCGRERSATALTHNMPLRPIRRYCSSTHFVPEQHLVVGVVLKRSRRERLLGRALARVELHRHRRRRSSK
ncbi:hypothetical protein EVAR_49101_1 [Eumeta japonica]|uniref:Uncharacterized protein n=1 Tax=Eumeta variegata TaxID=151549 RepID=A0A4C1ZSH3_EUMVA|nr:hypothetical protein EVAR_49101_1 [Eumeta japonica]